MSSNEKQIQNINMSTQNSEPLDDKYQKIYDGLDESFKKQVDKYKDKKIKQQLLEDIDNPKLKEKYDSFGQKMKMKFDAFPIRDKYSMLKEIVNKSMDTNSKVDELTTQLSKSRDIEYQEMYDKLDDYTKRQVNRLPNKTEKQQLVKNIYEKLDDEYQEMYDKLDSSTKEKVNHLFIKSKKQEILKDIYDPELKSLFDNLDEFSQFRVNNKDINAKYTTLKIMLKSNEKRENASNTELQKELFDEYDTGNNIKKQDKKGSENLPAQLDELVKTYYSRNPFIRSEKEVPELEVRFGTKGHKHLNKTDYENVIKKLKSLGFVNMDPNGEYYLRINCEYLDNITGRFKLSDVRVDIPGLNNIQSYCKNNDIRELYTSGVPIAFLKKKRVQNNKGDKVFPVYFNDFNFSVSYVDEISFRDRLKWYIIENWKKSKKTFRYLNRVTFTHPEYPFNIDISIVKYANRGADRFGNADRGDIIRVYTIEESNVFKNAETYEIEIEVDNRKIGPGTSFNSPSILVTSLRKVIKMILCGLQGTNFPISYPEQNEVLENYMKLIWKEEYVPNKRITPKNFIGPNSKTLQLVNICTISENSLQPNIRKDFVVTEKADGKRHLMYINDKGKIYLINMNMDVIFTGAKTNNKDNFNLLMDGELIAHDKKGNFINLYAAFDIYYYNNKDVRPLSFILLEKEVDNLYNARYQILKMVTNSLNPVSILDNLSQTQNQEKDKSMSNLLERLQNTKQFSSPIRIMSKTFYPYTSKLSIFNGCNEILQKVSENRYEYETDGLVFTHAYYGVGGEKIGETGPKFKKAWDYSFKWKPPKYNTIDFLVTTVKSVNNDDLVKAIFEDGLNMDIVTQISEYKTIELRCGFNEQKDGYINPCQDVIEDKIPDYKTDKVGDKDNYNTIYPVRFYPTEPYDPNAGLCKIMLKNDDSGTKQMFTEENEVFTDDTIVEFSYDFDREDGWRWVPLRVRYDKTSEYRQGFKQYGNSYETCNSNWKSIHYPITENMICTGQNIPDILVNEDTYYNTPAGKFMTEAMKNFHNLYVKKLLIKSVTKQGDTLIDYACGKAGDLPKWNGSKLSFVFGIDISKDNLENRLDGACARFLNAKKINKNMPYALFVNGNSAFNIKNGNAMLNDKAIQITKAVFGMGPKEADKIGKGVSRQYGVGEEGFHVSSCQFATHYFLENPDTLQGFLRNISECTKLNGYFIGTAYDGKLVFNMLKKVKTGESVEIIEDGKKIWEIVKGYGSDRFYDDSSCIGYRIDVFQESINQLISEYLINFDYFTRVIENYGFKLVNRDQAKHMGLPDGTGLFSDLFTNMEMEIKANKYIAKDYKNAINLTSYEKKISFLNRYFVYKKIREVNADKVQLDFDEYTEYEINENQKETKEVVSVSNKEMNSFKPEIKKLGKKIVLKEDSESIQGNTRKQPVKRKKIVIVDK